MHKLFLLLLCLLTGCAKYKSHMIDVAGHKKTLGVQSYTEIIEISLPIKNYAQKLQDRLNKFSNSQYNLIEIVSFETIYLPGLENYLKHVLPNLREIRYRKSNSFAKNKIAIRLTNYDILFPICPDWSSDIPGGRNNLPTSNFGCSKAMNLGLMLDNPHDLITDQKLISSLAKNKKTEAKSNEEKIKTTENTWFSRR